MWRAGLTEYLNGLCAYLFEVDTQTFQHASRDAFTFAHKAEQEMFSTNIVMIQATSFIHGQLDHLFGAWRQADLTQDNAITTSNNKFNGPANLVQFDAQITQYFDGDSLPLTHEAQQLMFGTDVIV